jgi:hypothetical protein
MTYDDRLWRLAYGLHCARDIAMSKKTDLDNARAAYEAAKEIADAAYANFYLYEEERKLNCANKGELK